MRANMLALGSCVIDEIGFNWAQQFGFYRFINNPRVTESGLLSHSLSAQNIIEQDEPLFVIRDTSQINLNDLSRSIKDKEGLGVLNDGLTLGYHLHGRIVINKDFEVKGISDAVVYNRTPQEMNRVTI